VPSRTPVFDGTRTHGRFPDFASCDHCLPEWHRANLRFVLEFAAVNSNTGWEFIQRICALTTSRYDE
jgi:hypothetical protein